MIAVVTITYNPLKDGILEPFLACLRKQAGANIVSLVIDNASVDGTRERLSDHTGDNFHVLLNEKNIGFAAACNQGIAFAREKGADHILFLNNDTEFGESMVADLSASLDRSGADAISPLIVHFDEPSKIWYAGGHFSKLLGYVNVHDHDRREIRYAPSQIEQTDMAPGCCLMTRLTLFDRIGPWDERFFVYWEDTDLCLRIADIGGRISIDPAISILHKASTSTGGKLSDFTIEQANRNHMLLLRKHFGVGAIAYTLVMIAAKTSVNMLIGRLSWRQTRLKMRAISRGLFGTVPIG